MIARRDLLKVAAAVGASRALVPDVSRADAARLLAEPAATVRSQWRDAEDLFDPVNFAENAQGSLGNDFDQLLAASAPEQWARYHRARHAMAREVPALHEARNGHPWHETDEAALALWHEAFAAGLRAGAAYENLRLALIGPRQE